jgi:hypothetical protein
MQMGPSSLEAASGDWFTVQPATEAVMCSDVQLTNENEIDIVSIVSKVSESGLYRLVVYKSDATGESSWTPCDSWAGVSERPLLFFALAGAHPMRLDLPPGTAFYFAPHQMVRIEAHFVNAAAQTLVASGSVEFLAGNAGPYAPADVAHCGTVKPLDCASGGGLAAGRQHIDLASGRLPASGLPTLSQLNLFGLLALQGSRGVGVAVTHPLTDSWTSGETVVLHDQRQPLTIAPSPLNGIEWQCSYSTLDDSQTLCNERCTVLAYYYPAVAGGIDCEQ